MDYITEFYWCQISTELIPNCIEVGLKIALKILWSMVRAVGSDKLVISCQSVTIFDFDMHLCMSKGHEKKKLSQEGLGNMTASAVENQLKCVLTKILMAGKTEKCTR